ncbi:MAG: ABC transporter substrate-binding protein, partial [Firmicutes bacterium]|nr:ABC transporter substrate-binding protein [Bacillota bacterium]
MNRKKGAAALLALLLALPAGGTATSGGHGVINRTIASNNAKTLENLPEAARARADTLIIGVPDLYGEMNPFFVKTTGDGYLASLLYDELLFQNNRGELGAGVAAFEISPDGHTYTFTIQEGVRYLDGEPVTSDDFINALYLLLMPGFDGVYDITRASIRGVDAYLRGEANAIEGIARVNNRVFSVTLDIPNAENLIFLAVPALRVSLFGDMRRTEETADPEDFTAFCQEALARVRAADASNMAYGQYGFVSLEPGVRATLAAHEAYWRGKPYIGTVELLVVPTDAMAALDSMLDGTVDIVSVLGSVEIVSIAYDTGFINLYTWEGDVLGYLGMDMESALFSDPSIREALAIGMDREAMRKSTLERYGALPTMLLFDSFGINADMLSEKFPFDPERAASLLEDAGWVLEEDGIRHRNGQDFSFTLTYNTPNPFMDRAVYQMQADFAALGIDMRPKAVSLEELMELVA